MIMSDVLRSVAQAVAMEVAIAAPLETGRLMAAAVVEDLPAIVQVVGSISVGATVLIP